VRSRFLARNLKQCAPDRHDLLMTMPWMVLGLTASTLGWAQEEYAYASTGAFTELDGAGPNGAPLRGRPRQRARRPWSSPSTTARPSSPRTCSACSRSTACLRHSSSSAKELPRCLMSCVPSPTRGTASTSSNSEVGLFAVYSIVLWSRVHDHSLVLRRNCFPTYRWTVSDAIDRQ